MKNSAFVFLCAVFFAGCNSPQISAEKLAADFADLECRAVALRQSRFALADSIRFAEDTMLMFKDDSLVQQRLRPNLQRYNGQKITLVKSSLELTDTIRMQLDSLMTTRFVKIEDRKIFDAALAKELEKRGCK